VLDSGQCTEVRLKITSHTAATQLLAVALQQVKEEPTGNPEYIGIASTNIAFVEPLQLDYETRIEPRHIAGDDPLVNSSTAVSQISASLTLSMVGDASLAVQGITFRHSGLVSRGQRLHFHASLTWTDFLPPQDEAGVKPDFQSIDTAPEDGFPQGETIKVINSARLAHPYGYTVWVRGDSYGIFNTYNASSTNRSSLDIFRGQLEVSWKRLVNASMLLLHLQKH